MPATTSFGQLGSLFALAVQRHHVYPSDNPVLTDALKACHRALGSLDKEHLTIQVSPRTLLIDEAPLHQSTGIAECAGRLHRGAVASITLFRDASVRELSCLCRELVIQEQPNIGEPLPDRLKARGVDRIQVVMQIRPAILEVGSPHASLVARLRADQTDIEANRRRTGRLFRADKGWVRLDAGIAGLESVPLFRLAELVGDPIALAGMLAALADEPLNTDPADTLVNKFEEVALLMRSAEPEIATALLGRLARAVRALDPDRRQTLLRNTILPALMDGKMDGMLMREFPDVELADALALLLDLQVAAPELLRTALDRLELPVERRRRVEPLLNERLLNHGLAAGDAATPGHIDGLSGQQIRVDLSRQKQFRDFGSVDLAIDTTTEAQIGEARTTIAATRGAVERTRCLVHLLRFEANPETASRFLAGILEALRSFARENDLDEVAAWVRELRHLEGSLRDARLEIAQLIASNIASLADDRLIDRLVRTSDSSETADAPTARVIDAFGQTIVPPLVAALERETSSARRTALRRMMCANARALAPGVTPHLTNREPEVTRAMVAVLGHAGAGHELSVGGVLRHPDGRVTREAMRALVQIGTAEARRLVASVITADGELGRLAEDAIWQFPEGRVEACHLLGRTDFAATHPAVARRLLIRAAERKRDDLAPLLRDLSRLRKRIWRPAQFQLGQTAARLGRGL